jgi:hypothetical protein
MNSIKTISELAAKVEEIVVQCTREGVVFNSCKAKHLVEEYCSLNSNISNTLLCFIYSNNDNDNENKRVQ